MYPGTKWKKRKVYKPLPKVWKETFKMRTGITCRVIKLVVFGVYICFWLLFFFHRIFCFDFILHTKNLFQQICTSHLDNISSYKMFHAIVIPLVLGVFCGMVVQVYNTGTYLLQWSRPQTDLPQHSRFLWWKNIQQWLSFHCSKGKKSHHIQNIKSYTLLLCHINITKL